MIKGAVDSIESFGLVDGPGIRTVIFLSGCQLRCKYCHNPEMWVRGKENYTPEELAQKILRNKNYFGKRGGVTFSGGEPLLQSDFIIEVAKILKKENIHIALDTAGVGNGHYEKILNDIDLVLLDIKHTNKMIYHYLTSMPIDESLKFIEALNQSNTPVWIRQVIVPGMMDNQEYLKSLVEVCLTIKNIEKIEFLPYHKLGQEKYQKLKIPYPYQEIPEMDKEQCQELYQQFMEMYTSKLRKES